MEDRAQRELAQVLSEFRAESDRGAALLGAAYLDEKLVCLFRSRFWDDTVGWDLLRQGGPIGTFGVRASLAHALGWIRPHSLRDLKRIQKVRDYFAHQMQVATFSDDLVRSHCMELPIAKDIDTFSEGMGWAKASRPPEPRLAFLITVGMLGISIDEQTRDGSWRHAPWPPKG
jgi:hypothetical protein